MRKTGLFAVAAALILATGIGGWAASNTQARVATAASIGINPFQMMTNAQASGHGALSGFFDGIPLKPVASIRQSFGFQSRLTLGHLPPPTDPEGLNPALAPSRAGFSMFRCPAVNMESVGGWRDWSAVGEELAPLLLRPRA